MIEPPLYPLTATRTGHTVFAKASGDALSRGEFPMLHAADCHDITDARLETALGSHTLAELLVLQNELQGLYRDGTSIGDTAVALQHFSPDVALWLSTAGSRADALRITMQLAALSVAIAWQTYRARSAPVNDIRRAPEPL